jgi:hypothetical protein
VVRKGWGQGGEMNQALYAHMNNKRKIKKKNKNKNGTHNSESRKIVEFHLIPTNVCKGLRKGCYVYLQRF